MAFEIEVDFIKSDPVITKTFVKSDPVITASFVKSNPVLTVTGVFEVTIVNENIVLYDDGAELLYEDSVNVEYAE